MFDGDVYKEDLINGMSSSCRWMDTHTYKKKKHSL